MDTNVSSQSAIEAELYFLIARFLSAGPCKKTSKVFLEELEKFKLLQKRLDWEGNEHFRTYENLVYLNRHIRNDHLLQIVKRIGPLLDKEIKPSVSGVRSLLGAGSLSLLRTTEDIEKTKWGTVHHLVRQHGAPKYPPSNLAVPHITHVLPAYQMSGVVRVQSIVPASLYSKISMHGRKLGHLDSVYCVLFDRTGNYIFTAADDKLVKIWSRFDMRLLATLRGHSAEITDMALSYENTYLASVSLDKSVRIWNLRTKEPTSVLHAHSSMITSVQFCPKICGDNRYLVSTGNDGCVCFWQYNCNTDVFNPKPIKFIEKSRAGAQMLCSSFSPGGAFLATGSSDHVVRVYFLHAVGPEKICELEAHADKVDSICYSNHHNSFISGSNDGTARLWRYDRQEWRAIVLNVFSKQKGKSEAGSNQNINSENIRVTMVSWTQDDSMVVTAASDFTIKIWNAHTGSLLRTLEGHEDEVYVLEASPTDARIVVSAGHDGKIFIWDITTGTKIKRFFNLIEGQGHGAVFDCKFSPCGQYFAATDSHGHLLLMGFGTNERCKRTPPQLFFHSDYRPLIRDANGYCLDEQTQQPPHLMAPPFLVDVDGNPYPPAIQRLVPGRENCKESSLIPHMAVNAAGEEEVVGETETNNEQANERNGGVDSDSDVDPELISEPASAASFIRTRPSIDVMIEELQRQQDQRLRIEPSSSSSSQVLSPPPPSLSSPPPTPRGNGHSRVGMRRSGEIEGVRQSRGNVSSVRSTENQRNAWKRQIFVQPMEPALLKFSEERRLALSEEEVKKFLSERKKKLLSPLATSLMNTANNKNRRQKSKKSDQVLHPHDIPENVETARNRLTTRALYDTEEEEDEGGGTDLDLTESDSSEEYSDWVGDQGSSNLEPPKRRSLRKRKYRRIFSTDEESDNKNEEEETSTSSSEDSSDTEEVEQVDQEQPSKRTSKQRKKAVKKKTEKKEQVSKRQQKKRRPESIEHSKEMDEKMRPPDWITTVIPRKAPFVPQMGDEVVYFRQGHEQYLQAVVRKEAYKVDLDKNQPWHKNSNLKAHEFVKIVGIKWLMKPIRLCCMKLAFIDVETGKLTGKSFTIRYHDMPDVIDFIVLRQHYDISIDRGWKQGSRFRSMIDDQWWLGIIKSQEPLSTDFPNSLYQCFNVQWDNGEYEKLSPWDMESVDQKRKPAVTGGGIDVTADEYKALLYVPKKTEWPSCGREEESQRLVQGISILMQHSWAEPFSAPVDLQRFPTYAYFVPYPIDLSTIKTRLENGFYRRVTALQWDVRLIHSNASIFNQSGSRIVKNANALTETVLRFIKEHACHDPLPFLHELSNEVTRAPSSDDDYSQNNAKKGRRSREKNRPSAQVSPDVWLEESESLLAMLFECEDSEPFRLPVDPDAYPDYEDVVGSPMDLTTVHTKLATGHYKSPQDISRDIRLIFNNSKIYNTNKRSRIYSMTLRLSALFEDQIKQIISRWKSARGNTSQSQRLSRNVQSQRRTLDTDWSAMSTLIESGPSVSGVNMPSTSRGTLIRQASSRASAAWNFATGERRRLNKENQSKKPLKDDSDDSDATIVETENSNVCDERNRQHKFLDVYDDSNDDDDDEINIPNQSSKTSLSAKGKTSNRAKAKTSKSLSKRSNSRVKRSNYRYASESDDDFEEDKEREPQSNHSQNEKLDENSQDANESSGSETTSLSASHKEKQSVRKSGRLKKGSYSRRFSPDVEFPHLRKNVRQRKRLIESDDDEIEEEAEAEMKGNAKGNDLKRSARSSRTKRTYYQEDDSDELNEDNVNDEDVDIDIDNHNNSESEEASSTEEEEDVSEDEMATSPGNESKKSKPKILNGNFRSVTRKRQLHNDSEGSDNDSNICRKRIRSKSSSLRTSNKKQNSSISVTKSHRVSNSKGRKNNSNMRTRNRGKQIVTYLEDSEDEDGAKEDSSGSNSDDDDIPASRSISCRGRLRKLTPRAKASLKIQIDLNPNLNLKLSSRLGSSKK